MGLLATLWWGAKKQLVVGSVVVVVVVELCWGLELGFRVGV